MIQKIIPFAHQLIQQHIHKDDIVFDMTMGNGLDTLFLSKLAKHVYAFDIQEKALKNTSSLLEKNGILNVTLIQDSHEFASKHYDGELGVIVFNLGYLPGGDKSISTNPEKTIKAIDTALPLLKVGGIMCITVYPGHKFGKIESELLLKYVTTLHSGQFNVLTYSFINKKNSPYNILIEKN